MVRYPAKYTEVLINLLESEQVRPLIDNALSDYPIYVSNSQHEYIPNIIPTREEINRKILNYYKYREIGFETIGRFLDELRIAMNEIMPYYNQLMFTQDQDYNIIYNVDYVKSRNVNRNENGTSETNTSNRESTTGETSSEASGSDSNTTNSTSNSNSKNVKSNTPQDSLSITAANIDSVTYADEVNWNKSNATDQATSTGSTSSTNETTSEGTSESSGTSETQNEFEGTEAETETTKGNYGVVSAQDLVIKYRQTIINIEQMIINDPRIQELFMTVY